MCGISSNKNLLHAHPGFNSPDFHQISENMKEHSEKRTATAVKLLIMTLTRNFYDTGIVLDEFEAIHDDCECDQSKQYAALVAGHFALKDALEKINNRLNK